MLTTELVIQNHPSDYGLASYFRTYTAYENQCAHKRQSDKDMKKIKSPGILCVFG